MILKIAAVQNCNDTSTLFCCTALHWILLCLYFCWTSRLASGWSWRNPVAVLSSGLAVVQLFTLTNKTLKGTLDIRLSPLCWSLLVQIAPMSSYCWCSWRQWQWWAGPGLLTHRCSDIVFLVSSPSYQIPMRNALVWNYCLSWSGTLLLQTAPVASIETQNIK